MTWELQTERHLALAGSTVGSALVVKGRVSYLQWFMDLLINNITSVFLHKDGV